MATEKERKLMGEIMDLAVDVTLAGGEYKINAQYLGHIHAFDIRIMDSKFVLQNESCHWACLSGKNDLWDEAKSVNRLKEMLTQVKQHHPAFDADGVKL